MMKNGDGSFSLSGNQGRVLMSGCEVAVQLSDKRVVSSKDPRFKISSSWIPGINRVTFKDSQSEIDFSLSCKALDDLSVRIEVDLSNKGDKSMWIDRIVAIEGYVARNNPAQNCKVLITSAGWQDEKIVYTLDESLKSVESMFTVAVDSPALAAGFLEGRKHFNHFTLKDEKDALLLTAWGEGNGCELPAGGTRSMDPLFISLQENSLQQLERFADLAATENKVKLWPFNRAVWCSWYAGWNREKMYSYKEGIAKGIEENIPQIKEKGFYDRGAHTMRVCDDHISYGDWDDTTKAFPEGLSATAARIAAEGLIPGVWYPVYWASTGSDVYQQHPEWFALGDDGLTYLVKDEFQNKSRLTGGNKFLVFDTSVPEVQEYFEQTAALWRERGFKYVTCDFLAFATRPPKYHNPQLSKAEVLRAGLEAVRRGLGDDVFFRTIGAQFGPCMGLSNDVRISGDSHGDRPFAYHRCGSLWFYNHRLWFNDPSAIVFQRYGEMRDIEWNRMWVSWIAMAGTVMTYGEQIQDLPQECVNIYQRVFPPLNVAGRPLDLWENQPFVLWGMQPEPEDRSYCLFGVFDLDGKGKRNLDLNLDQVFSRATGWQPIEKAPEKYLLWDFWNRKLVESAGSKLTLPMPEKACRLFALRRYQGVPQLLGTSGHFSMGALETADLRWTDTMLTGLVKGNGGGFTTLFFHVPDGYKLERISVNGLRPVYKLEDRVLEIAVGPTAEFMPFELQFSGQGGCVLPSEPLSAPIAQRY